MGRCTSVSNEETGTRNQVGSRPYASIDADQEICPVLKMGIAAKLVLDIEVQAPSLSTPE